MKQFHHRSAEIGLLALLLTVLAFPCIAQEGMSRHEGYVFAASGIRTHEQAVTGINHFGGAFKRYLVRGLAAEAELGYLRPFSQTNEDLGLLSLNASYNLRKKTGLDRFVTAGFSFGLRDRTMGLHRQLPLDQAAETLNLINFGLGGTYWFSEGKGLRFELRDHIYLSETDRQYLELRIGFAFR